MDPKKENLSQIGKYWVDPKKPKYGIRYRNIHKSIAPNTKMISYFPFHPSILLVSPYFVIGPIPFKDGGGMLGGVPIEAADSAGYPLVMGSIFFKWGKDIGCDANRNSWSQ